MTKLSIGILGLGRVGTSIGLALRRYMSKGGKYQFEIVGYDPLNEKTALKVRAVDKVERQPYTAAANRDLVVLALSYDEVRQTYKNIAADLREGCVILDFSPLKAPSLQWAQELLSEEQHVIGATAILNPRYLFNADESAEQAQEDLFDDSTILLTPAASSIKEAVDLAFNFASLLGSRPRFLDPVEHDTLLTFTETLPKLLGSTLFYTLMHQTSWGDMQWFTNPAFAVLARPLHDLHPDAQRDEWLHNRETLVRALDTYLNTLQTVRTLLMTNDRAAVEELLGTAAEEYEKWVNHRHSGDWDAAAKAPKVDASNTILGSLFGEKIANRMLGKKDQS
jgi:prephenate dehydrogenase